MRTLVWENGKPIIRDMTVAEQVEFDPRLAMELTFAQMLIGLVSEGWITRAEGDAWLDGVLPTAVTAIIATLPIEHQFAATARAKRPSVIMRLDGLVVALAAMQGRTDTQMDTFFTTYAAI